MVTAIEKIGFYWNGRTWISETMQEKHRIGNFLIGTAVGIQGRQCVMKLFNESSKERYKLFWAWWMGRTWVTEKDHVLSDLPLN